MDIEFFKKEKTAAMKARDRDAVSALNVLIDKLTLWKIAKRAAGEELSDADVSGLMLKTEKELIEERDAFEAAGRKDTVEALSRQLETIRKYLPKMLTEDEIKAIIEGMEDRSVPSVMRRFKTEYAGKCDMRLVASVLKSLS